MMDIFTDLWKAIAPANSPVADILLIVCGYLVWLRHTETRSAREERKERLETAKLSIDADEKIAAALMGLTAIINRMEGLLLGRGHPQ